MGTVGPRKKGSRTWHLARFCSDYTPEFGGGRKERRWDQAQVDGVPAPIWPTNLLFRGVVVPPGEHQVTFRFRPRSWRLGLGLSGQLLGRKRNVT